MLLCIDVNSFLLVIGCKSRIVEIRRQKSINWREEHRIRGSRKHRLKASSSQVRFVLPKLLFEDIFVLDRKGQISQQE